MADVKISGLPASTTPLAGTEVLPIVQSGVTKQVSVANLTDGRAIAAASAVISDNSANAALGITQIGAGNALLVEDSANPDATPFVINNSGAALVGVDATRTLFTAYTPSLQVEGTTSSTFSQSITANINTSASPVMFFAKSRGTTNGSNTIVSANDTLGVISFNGADGTDIQSTAAQIVAAVDGTPGANDMPGRLVFSTTADGAVSSTERMRIASTGIISLGAAPGSESLRVTPVASAVNYLNVQGAITTASPSITAAGSDTNIDLALTPKGTGVLKFGTYTAGILAQAGYITIKDAAGNTRNLLVG